MRNLAFLAQAVLALALSMTAANADGITGRTWELLAIDGVYFEPEATLRIEADGGVTGQAPCNGWGTRNRADLPKLDLRGIRATRMACDRLSDESAFFAALAAMTALELDGERNLVLTGPDGKSMEFVWERMNSLTRCKTCPPKG